jgi:hypothetical protein
MRLQGGAPPPSAGFAASLEQAMIATGLIGCQEIIDASNA